MKQEKLPTAPFAAARLRMFQPTRRPRLISSDWMETPWGRVRVSGRLGQRHADLVELMLAQKLIHKWSEDGRLSILVDPYRLRTGMGKLAAADWLRGLLVDLLDAKVEWDYRAADVRVQGAGHVIDEIETYEMQTAHGFGSDAREVWKITFGRVWSRVIRRDLSMRHDPERVARIKSGVAQAVARLMLTHRPGGHGIKVDTVLDWLGIVSSTARRNARRELKKHVAALAEIGVSVADGKVTRR
ncbi:MAG: hypothetical protein D6681_15135 [Calditrichaeota bacterium]|nr:MAG: hypothetical protein D6681_15135 [Calditrichota bacterium]